MLNTSLNYLLKVNDPYTSSVIFPVKFLDTYVAQSNYYLKYAPVAQYPSILMMDYLIASRDRKFSPQVEEALIDAVKNEFNSDEFIVIEADTNKIAINNELVSFKRINLDEAHIEDSIIDSQRDNVKDMDILNVFELAWRDKIKNLELLRENQALRDLSHVGFIHQTSLPFLRDYISELGITVADSGLRDFVEELEVSSLGIGLRNYVYDMEIKHALGSSERDISHKLHTNFISESVRDLSHDLVIQSISPSQRYIVKNIGLSFIDNYQREKEFQLTKELGHEGSRPFEHKGTISWSEQLAERIAESSAIIQQTLLAKRTNEKGLYVNHVDGAKRNSLKEVILKYYLGMGKLKSREYPAHVEQNLLSSDRDIVTDIELIKTKFFQRSNSKQLSIALNSGYVRDNTTGLNLLQDMSTAIREIVIRKIQVLPGTIHRDLLQAVRATTNDLYIPYNLEAQRDNVEKLHIPYDLTEATRDITSSFNILYEIPKGLRENVIKKIEVRQDTLQFTRLITHDLYVPYSFHGQRDNLKGLYLPSEIRSTKPGSQGSDAKILNVLTMGNYQRDNEKGLYLAKERLGKRDSEHGLELDRSVLSERDNSTPINVSQSIIVERDKEKPIFLQTLTPSDRENVKDLLLGFIGDYIRNNLKDMVGNDHANETIRGGAVPINLWPSLLMEDEIFAELTDGFADVIETMVIGKVDRGLNGSILAEKMLIAKKRISDFIDTGLMQGTRPDDEGIILFNVDGLMGGVSREGELSETVSALRKRQQGIGLDSLEGSSINHGGVISDSNLLGITDEKEISGSVEDEIALGYINADPAAFLSPEELANLKLDSGLVSGSPILGSEDVNRGYVGEGTEGTTPDSYAQINHLIEGSNFSRFAVIGSSITAFNEEEYAYVETEISGHKGNNYGTTDNSFLAAKKNDNDGTFETVIEFIKEKVGVTDQLIFAKTPEKISYVEVEMLTSSLQSRSGWVNSEFNVAVLAQRFGYEVESFTVGEIFKKPSFDLEGFNVGEKLELDGYYVTTSLEAEGGNHLGTTVIETTEGSKSNMIGQSLVSDIQGSMLEKYSVTESDLLKSEKLKWVGILTNLLLADEGKGISYVEYLQEAGVIKQDHYHLLNGLVGDLAQKQGMAFGEEHLLGSHVSKAELLDSLQHGQGLVFKYDDFDNLLPKRMDIEEWELDLGNGLPEKYDPYDPYNSFYPWTTDYYDPHTLAQLEDWVPFGGANWVADPLHAQYRIKDNAPNPNGYILDNYSSVDYNFSVNFKVDLDETDDDGIGVVFKYVDENNYYKFVIAGGPGNVMRMTTNPMQLFKIVNGIQRPVGTALSPEFWVKDEWYNIKVSYVSKKIRIWVNDKLQYDMMDY